MQSVTLSLFYCLCIVYVGGELGSPKTEKNVLLYHIPFQYLLRNARYPHIRFVTLVRVNAIARHKWHIIRILQVSIRPPIEYQSVPFIAKQCNT